MSRSWLVRHWKGACLLGSAVTLSGCALDTSAIGLPVATESGKSTTRTPSTPRKDGATPESTAEDPASVSEQDAGVRSADADTGAPAVPQPSADSAVRGATDADGGSQSSPAPDAAPSRPMPSPLPALMDPWQAGPYTPASRAGASNTTVYYPDGLELEGRAHPVLIWDHAAGANASAYQSMLQHLASHGVVVVAAASPSVEGSEILAALSWILAENTRAGSPYFGTLDEHRVAAAGHGLGSIATFAVAADARLATTVHISGASNASIGSGHAAIDQLRHPAAFLCDAGGGNIFPVGDPRASCQADFERAPVPVFFATVGGPDQLNLPANVAGALVGWLRWLLQDDAALKPWFSGPSCTLCTRSNWTVKQGALETLP